MPVCVALTMGLQPHVPYGSLPAPQKTAQKSHGGWNSTTVRHPITPGRLDGVPLIPCSPRCNESINMLGVA